MNSVLVLALISKWNACFDAVDVKQFSEPFLKIQSFFFKR
jgi:hypothetical protein